MDSITFACYLYLWTMAANYLDNIMFLLTVHRCVRLLFIAVCAYCSSLCALTANNFTNYLDYQIQILSISITRATQKSFRSNNNIPGQRPHKQEGGADSDLVDKATPWVRYCLTTCFYCFRFCRYDNPRIHKKSHHNSNNIPGQRPSWGRYCLTTCFYCFRFCRYDNPRIHKKSDHNNNNIPNQKPQLEWGTVWPLVFIDSDFVGTITQGYTKRPATTTTTSQAEGHTLSEVLSDHLFLLFQILSVR